MAATSTLPWSERIDDYRSEEFLIPITRAISSRVIRPPGVDFEDTLNDCVVIYLRRVDQLLNASNKERKKLLRGHPIGKWLWVRVLGDLRDVYKRDWNHLIYGPKILGGFRGGVTPLLDEASKRQEEIAEVNESNDRMEQLYQYLLDVSTDQYALVFHRLFIEGRTQVQVARELNVTQPRISSIKHRIQAIIREHLAGDVV